MSKSYDPKCEELARYFAGTDADKRLVEELAAAIDQSIVDWLEDEKVKLENKCPDEDDGDRAHDLAMEEEVEDR